MEIKLSNPIVNQAFSIGEEKGWDKEKTLEFALVSLGIAFDELKKDLVANGVGVAFELELESSKEVISNE